LENKIYEVKQKSILSSIIFIATLVVVSITLVSVVFPALILRTLGGFEDYLGVNPFEFGAWALPFFIANGIILVLGILHIKKMLPKEITKSIRFILNFEISSQLALFVIVILIGVFITLSVGQFFDGRFDADYYERVKAGLESYKFTLSEIKNLPNTFGVISMIVFGNYKVIPFIASVALLVVTYLLASQIAKKRFAGIVAMCIVLQSGVFYLYDASVAYPSYWILFYLVSLYFVLRKQILSPVCFILGAMSKPLIAAFLPMSLFFIYRSEITKKKKVIITAIYGVIVSIAILGLFVLKSESTDYDLTKLSVHDFWGGFTAFNANLQHDGLILIFLLPLIIGLYIVYRRGVRHADSFMFLIMGILLSAPVLIAVSNITNTPYRFITLVTFFAIGTSILLSKQNYDSEK